MPLFGEKSRPRKRFVSTANKKSGSAKERAEKADSEDKGLITEEEAEGAVNKRTRYQKIKDQ